MAVGDILFDHVVLLIHADAADGSTTFTDTSNSAHAITVGGDAQVDSIAKYGTGSIQFDGSGDYLRLADSDDWSFGTANFTIDFWIRPTSLSADGEILAHRDTGDTTNFWYIRLTSAGKVRVVARTTSGIVTDVLSTATLSTGNWYHVRVERVSGHVSIYVNGTEGTADTTNDSGAWPNPAVYLWVGAGDSVSSYLNARVDDLRITKVARDGADFTPPAEAYPDGCDLAIAAQSAAISGSGTVQGERIGTGTLTSQAAVVSASGRAFTTLTGSGALTSQASSVAGTGGTAVTPSLPISLYIPQPVVVGLPIRIDIYSAVTPSLPITIGPYPITATLPIVFKTPVAATLPSVTITFPGAYSAITSALLTWKPKCILDGTDISAKLIGAQDIEFEESGAPVATFSFIPAAGAVDPLMYVGKTVSLSITIGTATYLAFSGIVSDPEWNADDRTITVSATGDLQSKLDAMTKTAIASTVGGTFSEYVFDDIENLSGWEYAEARVSTQPVVIWQDANGVIRTTSILAKATADYTFTASDILDTAQVVRWQGRMDFVNKKTVSLDYRFGRRRQRQLTFNFRPWQLETPSVYLSGNEGGWDLPQRAQIESAADGGGWTVIGDITYTPVWPNGYYSTYSDSGTPMMEGLSITPEVAAELCIAAKWTGAKRWLQTVTERYTMTVTASDSIAAVGTLATDESYAIEDDATDEAWESSLDYDGYVSGAVLMGNGLDKKADLDSLRTDVTTAMSVVLAKAQADVLKSHRGTTVSFTTTYDPRIDLSHTLEVDTTYLDCKGKIRRLAHHWDIDTGDCTTEVEIALSRHNGSGLATSDTLTPPSEPADKTEAAPSTYHTLEMHIGGQTTVPDWDDTWDGYVVNMPFSTTAGNNTILGSWARNPANPEMANKLYEEGFHVLPPSIPADAADPAEVTGTATYDVEVPEDDLVLVSG